MSSSDNKSPEKQGSSQSNRMSERSFSSMVIERPQSTASDAQRGAQSGETKATPPARLAFARLSPLKHLLALAILALVAIARFLPSFESFTEQYLGGVAGDNGLYVWLFRLHIHQLGDFGFFETNGFFPYLNTLAWSDNFLLPGMLGLVLVKYLGLTEPAAYNGIIITAFALSGYFSWLLVARLSGSVLSGLLAAVAWLSWTYWGLQVGHPQLLFHGFLPAGLYLFFSTVRAPSALRGAAAVGLVVAALATTVHYAVFLLITWFILSIALLVIKPQTIFRRANLSVLLGAIGASPLLLPFAIPYLQTAAVFGARELYEAHYFSATVSSWFAASPASRLYGGLSMFGSGEAFLFPGVLILVFGIAALLRLCRTPQLARAVGGFVLLGFITICFSSQIESTTEPYLWRVITAVAAWASIAALLGVGLILRRSESRRGLSAVSVRDVLFLVTALGWMGVLLSFGPLGNPEKGQMAIGPWSAFHEIFPGASSIRAVSRLGILGMLALCVCGGLLLGHAHARNQLMIFVSPFLILIAWVEGAMVIQPATGLPPRPMLISRLIELGDETSGKQLEASDVTVVMVLPYSGVTTPSGAPESWTEFATLQTTYLNWLTPSSVIAVNGYSGQQTKFMRELARPLRGFPDERSLNVLCGIVGLKYVYTDRSALPKSGATDHPALVPTASSSEGALFQLACDELPLRQRTFLVAQPLPADRRTFSFLAQPGVDYEFNPSPLAVERAGDRVAVTVAPDLLGRPTWITVRALGNISLAQPK